MGTRSETEPMWPSLPSELRDLFAPLWQEVSRLHASWELYLDLFGDEEKIDVLNATVPSVFQIIEENLRESMTVSIGRLTDRAKTGNRTNLSLVRMIGLLPTYCDRDFSEEAARNMAAILAECEPLTLHRNRRVAHNDLATMLQYQKNPLPGIGRQRIMAVLEKIAALMNLVERRFCGNKTNYGHGIQLGTGADLLFLLEQALEYDRENLATERAKLRSTKSEQTSKLRRHA